MRCTLSPSTTTQLSPSHSTAPPSHHPTPRRLRESGSSDTLAKPHSPHIRFPTVVETALPIRTKFKRGDISRCFSLMAHERQTLPESLAVPTKPSATCANLLAHRLLSVRPTTAVAMYAPPRRRLTVVPMSLVPNVATGGASQLAHASWRRIHKECVVLNQNKCCSIAV